MVSSLRLRSSCYVLTRRCSRTTYIPGQCGPLSTLQLCAVLSGLDPDAVHNALTISDADPQHAKALHALLTVCRRCVVHHLEYDNSAGGCGDLGFWVNKGDLPETPDKDALSCGDIHTPAQWKRLMLLPNCHFDNRAIRILARLLDWEDVQIVRKVAPSGAGNPRYVDVRSCSARLRYQAGIQWVRRNHFRAVFHNVSPIQRQAWLYVNSQKPGWK